MVKLYYLLLLKKKSVFCYLFVGSFHMPVGLLYHRLKMCSVIDRHIFLNLEIGHYFSATDEESPKTGEVI